MINEIRNELSGHIIPFWDKLIDREQGGFYGLVSGDLKLDKNAPKGVILNSRILWFYANCYLTIGGEQNLKNARHAFNFLREHCYDNELGGVYWMLDAKGDVLDGMKHTYNQAFAIYALASYYDASKDKEALCLAYELFDTIESKTRDEYGYVEAFTRDWQICENDALSENGIVAEKTMNCVLHLIEAYTELYRVHKFDVVEERLRSLLDCVKDNIYDDKGKYLRVFFSTSWEPLGDIHSYGHDIEAAWLIDRACEVIGDENLIEFFRRMGLSIARNILDLALEDGALNNERDGSNINRTRIWWVQAEGVVGFLNAYQQSARTEYLEAAQMLWSYIKENIIDKREGGEWYYKVSSDGIPDKSTAIVEPWKCPYHNGRMCMEAIKRGKALMSNFIISD